MELYTLIKKKKSTMAYILDSIVLVLAVFTLFIDCFINPLFIVATVILGVLFYCTHFLTNIEFEYAYFGGELKVAKITNKSKRKTQMRMNLDEVTQIAPHGDRSVYKYENDKDIFVKDFTSRYKEVPYYEVIYSHEGKTYLCMMELEDEMIEEMCQRYGMKIKKMPKVEATEA